MPKSKLIKEIVNHEIDLMQAIDRLYLIAHDLQDANVCSWIKKEKDGFKNEDVPEYRKTVATFIGTYQIISAGRIETYSDTPLPTTGVPEEEMEKLNNWFVRDSLTSLLKQRELSESGKMTGIPLDPVFFSWFQKGTNIIMRKAMIYVSPLNIETILNSIQQTVIDLLLLYEDNYGKLDDLDIEVDNFKQKQNEAVRDVSKSIINGSFSGKTKIIIKGSNLGEDNNLEKTVEVSTTVNIDKKECKFLKFLKRIFKRS